MKRRNAFIMTAIMSREDEQKWGQEWATNVMKTNPDFVIVNITAEDGKNDESMREIIFSDKLKIVYNKWEKNFSLARNQGLDALDMLPIVEKFDNIYCAYLDADETILEGSFFHLEEILSRFGKMNIHLWTIYNTLEQKSMIASLFYPRMWPYKENGKLTGAIFEGVVHNQLLIDQNKYMVERNKLELLHKGYALSPDEMKQKHKRSESLLRSQIAEDNDSFFAHLNLAQLLRAKGDFVGTEKHAREVLRIVNPKIKMGQEKYRHALLMSSEQLSTALMAQRRFEEAVPHINNSLEIKPDYLDQILNKANVCLELKDLDAGEFWYKRYLFIKSKYDETRDNTNLILNHLNSGFIANYNLGIINIFKNNVKLATNFFKKSYEQEPTFKDAFQKYVNGLRLMGENELMNKEINIFMKKCPEKAYIVYNYFGDISIQDCNMELAKFNYYQAYNMAKGEDKDRMKNRWENLNTVFGEVSYNFFDTGNKQETLKERMGT